MLKTRLCDTKLAYRVARVILKLYIAKVYDSELTNSRPSYLYKSACLISETAQSMNFRLLYNT